MATVSAAFLAGLTTPGASCVWYLEIEGIPYAYGNVDKGSSWFAGSQFLGVKPWAKANDTEPAFPDLTPQKADFREGRVSMGQLRVELVDVDGTLAGYMGVQRSDGRLTLTDAATATDGTLTFEGDATDWPSSGTAYLHRETVTYTGKTSTTLTGVTRGLYRSTATRHEGRDTTAKLTGARLTQYPQSLNQRRVWLRVGFNPASDADCESVFTGVIANAGWDRAGHVLVISCDDQQALARKPIFTNLWDNLNPRGDLQPAIQVVAGSYGVLSNADWQADDGEYLYALVDNQVYAFRYDASLPAAFGGVSFHYLGTSTFGNAQFSGGVTPFGGNPVSFVPVIPVGSPSLNPQLAGSKFTAGAHPLQVLLQVFTSTGWTQDNTQRAAQNGAYDTLPAEWGLGIPADELDVAGIEDLIGLTPGHGILLPILETVKDGREWVIAECLRPFGFYLRCVFPGKLSVGWMRELTPDDRDAAGRIDINDLAIQSDGQFVQLQGPETLGDLVVSSLSWSASPRFADNKLVLRPPITFRFAPDSTEPDLYPDGTQVKVEAYGTQGDRINEDGTGFSLPGTDSARLRDDLLGVLSTRYGAPPTIIKVACRLDALLLAENDGTRTATTVNVGDIVRFTLDNLPDTTTGARGYSGTILEVWSQRVDLAKGLVHFELARTALGSGATRYLAPALVVVGWTAGTKTLEIEANHFTNTAGAYDDKDAFAATWPVRIYSADLASRSGVVLVSSITDATHVVLSAVPDRTPVAGDVVLLADFDDAGQLSVVTNKYAFRASNERVLGTATSPHVYG
jgi:hypothetical protein